MSETAHADDGRIEAIARAVIDCYKPEGVVIWWRAWLNSDAAARRRMERMVVALAEGVVV